MGEAGTASLAGVSAVLASWPQVGLAGGLPQALLGAELQGPPVCPWKVEQPGPLGRGSGSRSSREPGPSPEKSPSTCGREGCRQMAEPFSASMRAD